MTTETITLGGGCFWCTESVFVNVLGITDVEMVAADGIMGIDGEAKIAAASETAERLAA